MHEEVETLLAENLQVSTRYLKATLAMLEAQRDVEESRATTGELSPLEWEKLQDLRELSKSYGEAEMKARLWDIMNL